MISRKKFKVKSPVNGYAVQLQDVNDAVFSSEMLGKGIAVIPEDGKVYSPINGKIVMAFETKHAIGLVDNNGLEILIHIGLDTVKLNGQHFRVLVQPEDKVVTGQLLVEFENEEIKKLGFDTIIPIVVTNTGDFTDVTVMKIGNVICGEDLLEVQK